VSGGGEGMQGVGGEVKEKYRNFQSSIIFYSVGTIRFYDKRS